MSDRREARRKRVMLGELPADFLRISPHGIDGQVNGHSSAEHTINYPPAPGFKAGFVPPNITGILSLTVTEADLMKNYGMTKMDPYVRIRIGHDTFETLADIRGGKHPTWHKTFETYLPQGIKTIFFDIYDECALTPDVRVAYTQYPIPKELLQGQFLDAWIPLSGQQGNGKEGKLHIICTFTPTPVQPPCVPYASAPMMMVTNPYFGLPYYQPGVGPFGPTSTQHTPANIAQPNPITCIPVPPFHSEILQLQEMFPSFDKETIVSVLQNSNGDKDKAANMLLSMS